MKRKFKVVIKDKKSVLLTLGIRAVLIILIASIGLLIAQLCLEDGAIKTAITVISGSFESIGLIVTILMAIIQFKDDNEVQTASFIRSLNADFIRNEKNVQIYDKLSACNFKECPKIGECELNHKYKCIHETDGTFSRSQISNYFTFFETIYILYKKGTIDIEVIDELFGYRFFLACHSKVMQDMKLYSPTNFYNIYALEHIWVKYRIDKGKLDKEKYYEGVETYRKLRRGEITPKKAFDLWENVYYSHPLRGLFPNDEQYKFFLNNRRIIGGDSLDGFEVKKLGPRYLNKILKFQDRIIGALDNKEFIRKNSPEMFLSCLKKPNISLGLFDNKKLVGLTILYNPKNKPEEDLSHLVKDKKENIEVWNYKYCAIDPNYRGHKIQQLLEKELEKYLPKEKEIMLCTAVHPENIASKKSILNRKFCYATTVEKYDSVREIYYKYLQAK